MPGIVPGHRSCTSRAQSLRRGPGKIYASSTSTAPLSAHSCAPLRSSHLATPPCVAAASRVPAAVLLSNRAAPGTQLRRRHQRASAQARQALPESGTIRSAATDTMDSTGAAAAAGVATSAGAAPAPGGIKLVLVVGVALIDDGSGRGGSTAAGGPAGAGPGPGSGAARVLLAQRPPGKANAGLWEFPGGKVDAGETPEAALVRELREELGIRVAAHDLQPLSFVSYTYPTFHLLMPLYACRRWEGEPHGAEGQAVVWAGEAELLAAGAAAAAAAPGEAAGAAGAAAGAAGPATGATAVAGAAAGSGRGAVRYPLTPADIPLVPAVVAEMGKR